MEQAARITTPQPGDSAQLELPQAVESVRLARRFVRSLVEDPAISEVAELLVSELATNAVVHAATAFSVRVLPGPPVRVEVLDSDRRPPRPGPGELDSPSGRGIRLVAALSHAWGIEITGEGKTVWFEVI